MSAASAQPRSSNRQQQQQQQPSKNYIITSLHTILQYSLDNNNAQQQQAQQQQQQEAVTTPTSPRAECPWEESSTAVIEPNNNNNIVVSSSHRNNDEFIIMHEGDTVAAAGAEFYKSPRRLSVTTTTTTTEEEAEEAEAEEVAIISVDEQPGILMKQQLQQEMVTSVDANALTDAEIAAAAAAAEDVAEESSYRMLSPLRRTMRCYKELWKTRLSSLVLLTTMGAFYCEGGWSQPWYRQVALGVGTFLQAACANSLNEIIEVDRDRIMNRTKKRPLPTGRISSTHALVQAAIVGTAGTYMLYRLNSPKTAILGFMNIVTYAGAYTPMKVRHWINTWIGTLNGSLPPLMGSAAATGGNITSPSAMYFFSSMYLWQITHFMAIGYKCKGDYSKAGYKMLPIDRPKAAALQSVLHAALLLPLCWSMGPPGFDVAPWWFVVGSTPVNYYMLLKPALQFYRETNYQQATKLFFKSMGHLIVLFGMGVAAWTYKDSSDRLTNSVGAWLWDALGSVGTGAMNLFQRR